MWIGHRTESLYGGQFTLSTPLIKPNFCILLPHRRSTTVSLETTPSFIYNAQGKLVSTPEKRLPVAETGWALQIGSSKSGFNTTIVNYDTTQGPVVQKAINANPRLKINRGVYFSTPKCCSTLIFGKTLH